jgi:hypothetical protein
VEHRSLFARHTTLATLETPTHLDATTCVPVVF